jgi:hypothetical protein
MALFALFLLRLAFGLTLGMAITSPRLVASGYFRNNLYVSLGLTLLAAMLCRAAAPEAFWYAALAAIVSFLGAACWLYERADGGKAMLLLVAMASLAGSFGIESSEALADSKHDRISDKYFSIPADGEVISAEAAELLSQRARRMGYAAGFLGLFSNVSSGLLLGATMAAMLLGHWYLNSPTMQLAPLRRLILAMGAATVLQAVVSSLGLWGELANAQHVATQWTLFLALRWCFGLAGVAVLTWMAWQTLKIPNTQSATGILYVAVIGTFVGETMGLLLSAESAFPL